MGVGTRRPVAQGGNSSQTFRLISEIEGARDLEDLACRLKNSLESLTNQLNNSVAAGPGSGAWDDAIATPTDTPQCILDAFDCDFASPTTGDLEKKGETSELISGSQFIFAVQTADDTVFTSEAVGGATNEEIFKRWDLDGEGVMPNVPSKTREEDHGAGNQRADSGIYPAVHRSLPYVVFWTEDDRITVYNTHQVIESIDFTVSESTAIGFEWVESYGYLMVFHSDSSFGPIVVDFSDFDNPTEVAKPEVSLGSDDRGILSQSNDVFYSWGGGSAIYVWKITPESPHLELLQSVNVSSGNPGTAAWENEDFLFFLKGNGGWNLYDKADDGTLSLNSSGLSGDLSFPMSSLSDSFSQVGDSLLVAGPDNVSGTGGIAVIDLSTPTNPTVDQSINLGSFGSSSRVNISGQRIITSDGTGGVYTTHWLPTEGATKLTVDYLVVDEDGRVRGDLHVEGELHGEQIFVNNVDGEPGLLMSNDELIPMLNADLLDGDHAENIKVDSALLYSQVYHDPVIGDPGTV